MYLFTMILFHLGFPGLSLSLFSWEVLFPPISSSLLVATDPVSTVVKKKKEGEEQKSVPFSLLLTEHSTTPDPKLG